MERFDLVVIGTGSGLDVSAAAAVARQIRDGGAGARDHHEHSEHAS